MNNDQSLEKGKQDMQSILNELDQRIKNPQPTDNAGDAGQAGFDWAHHKISVFVDGFIKSIKDDKDASVLLAYYRKGMGTTWKEWRAAEMAKVTKVVKG